MSANEKKLLEEQFDDVQRLLGWWLERHEGGFVQDFENLPRLYPSDTVLFDHLVNHLRGKSLVLGIEEELEELAEKGVE